MDVITKTSGTITVTAEHLIEIPEGLFGFEDYTKYAIIESEYEPFLWLQSCQNKDVAFLIVDPFLICSYYETDIDDETLKRIGITKPEEIIVMTIVTVPHDGSPITANFQGPLVINKKNQKCMQVILNDNRWTTKVNIVDLLNSKGAE